MTAANIAPPGLAAVLHVGSFRERLLLTVLFMAVLASSVAFIEPSPHDVLMALLAIVALAAGIRLERALALPFLLLLIWNFAGMLALMHVPGEQKAIQYTATSVYLAIAALLFACIFVQNTMVRLAAMRTGYVTTAVIATFIGATGYFNLFGTGYLFAPLGRALGAFKDPNVFGPFLIWPALFLLYRMIARGVRFSDAVIAGIILFGLLLSFSRGAWFHFAVSCVVMVALAFVTATNVRSRARVLAVSAMAIAALSLLFLFLLSFDAIQDMFEARAHLIQSYDVGQGGRFRLQEIALAAVLNFPYGMGPFEFARVHGLQQHNMYLQAFLVYGWLGAIAYILLLLSTTAIGLRNSLSPTPWQPYLITATAAFVGAMAEGLVIDTDHWRHFYLLLGMIWGLAAATLRQAKQSPERMYARA